MTIRMGLIFCIFQVALMRPAISQKLPVNITSPDKKIKVALQVTPNGEAVYTVEYNASMVLQPSKLGLKGAEHDFSEHLRMIGAPPVSLVNDAYELFTGKKKVNYYRANKRTVHLVNGQGNKMDIIFQVSNDGVAFRYFFPGVAGEGYKVNEEITSYHFDLKSKAFLQPMSVAKSGWEQTNPAYEEHYRQNIPVGTPEATNTGWVYPALFNYGDTWMLITEAALDGHYCATRLKAASPDGEYTVGFPDAREVIKPNGLLPDIGPSMYSPWRIITIGSLKTIAESTLGTDLAKPSVAKDFSFIKPGKSSWSWIMSKDNFIVYDEQKKYIDFAADMHWQYCLIDADWDRKIGYDKVKELAAYAATKNVSLLLWYNSAGDWNTVKYTPKNKLLTHESRMAEFARLKTIGIKGVKIDFFGGDGRSVIQYYIDILKDAGTAGLMVNFHGATLPRGWERTYPQLVTTEAVRGFEMVTFNQKDADAEANHCAMLPFTRNAFDPMDFTPINLYKIPTQVARKTSSAFELALSVLFLSGIQHIAESPEGMSHVPDYVKMFMQNIPNRWDDVQFIEGFPGKYVVMARKAGNKWFISGINAENTAKTITIKAGTFGKTKGNLITDGEEPLSFVQEKMPVYTSTVKEVTMNPNGGFVMVLE